MASKRTLQILGDLVKFPSVSSVSNAAISEYVRDFLQQQSLQTETLTYRDQQQQEKVNVVGTYGQGTGGLVYCAHTDVVPVDEWKGPGGDPFQLTPCGDKFYGRGSCDMKGSLACFLTALETIPLSELTAPVSILCTADEELGYLGAAHVKAHSEIYQQLKQQQPVTVIGEPTSLSVVHSHKGIYVFRVTSHGLAAHSSTDEGINANIKMLPFLQEMGQIYHETLNDPYWRDERFQPSGINWNIGINDFTTATNITPGISVCTVSYRLMPQQDPLKLLDRARRKAEELGLEFELHHGAAPVYVDPESPHIQAFLKLTGQQHSRTVSYGTDAAMLTDLQKVVVCGPGNIAQAHTVDEWISAEQLERGVEVYRQMIRRFCCS